MWPRLEYSGVILAHCSLCHLAASASFVAGITDVCNHAWLIFVFLVETGFPHVGQVSNSWPQMICPSQPPKVLGYHTWPRI